MATAPVIPATPPTNTAGWIQEALNEANYVYGAFTGNQLAKAQIASGQSGIVSYDANGRPISQTGQTAVTPQGIVTGASAGIGASLTSSSLLWIVLLFLAVLLILKK